MNKVEQKSKSVQSSHTLIMSVIILPILLIGCTNKLAGDNATPKNIVDQYLNRLEGGIKSGNYKDAYEMLSTKDKKQMTYEAYSLKFKNMYWMPRARELFRFKHEVVGEKIEGADADVEVKMYNIINRDQALKNHFSNIQEWGQLSYEKKDQMYIQMLEEMKVAPSKQTMHLVKEKTAWRIIYDERLSAKNLVVFPGKMLFTRQKNRREDSKKIMLLSEGQVKEISEHKGHYDISADGNEIVSVDMNRSVVQLYDGAGNFKEEILFPNNPSTIKFLSSNQLIYSSFPKMGQNDIGLYVYDMETKLHKQIYQFEEYDNPYRWPISKNRELVAIHWMKTWTSKDGEREADQKVKIVNLKNGETNEYEVSGIPAYWFDDQTLILITSSGKTIYGSPTHDQLSQMDIRTGTMQRLSGFNIGSMLFEEVGGGRFFCYAKSIDNWSAEIYIKDAATGKEMRLTRVSERVFNPSDLTEDKKMKFESDRDPVVYLKSQAELERLFKN